MGLSAHERSHRNARACGRGYEARLRGPSLRRQDVPANNGFSIRLRSISPPRGREARRSARLCRGDGRAEHRRHRGASNGRLTPATDVVYHQRRIRYRYDRSPYEKRCYSSFGKADPGVELVFGPNIADWPKIFPLAENVLVGLSAVIRDP